MLRGRPPLLPGRPQLLLGRPPALGGRPPLLDGRRLVHTRCSSGLGGSVVAGGGFGAPNDKRKDRRENDFLDALSANDLREAVSAYDTRDAVSANDFLEAASERDGARECSDVRESDARSRREGGASCIVSIGSCPGGGGSANEGGGRGGGIDIDVRWLVGGDEGVLYGWFAL